MNTNFFIDLEDLKDKNLLKDSSMTLTDGIVMSLCGTWFKCHIFSDNAPLSLHVSCDERSKVALHTILNIHDIEYKAYS